MSSWSRSSYNSAAAAPPAAAAANTDGWQTVGSPRSTRTWGSEQPTTSRWGQQPRGWPSSGGQDMPSAFSKKPRGDDRPPRRQTDEEARRDYMIKLAAEKAVKEAEQAKQIANTQDNFPSLGAPKRAAAAAAPPPPKSNAGLAQSSPMGRTQKSWATQIKQANDENEQKRLADEKAAAEAADKLAEGVVVLRLGTREEMRDPFFTTGEIEREADFFRNERLRRACFSSSIMEEQEKYDYNQGAGYGQDDLEEDAPPQRSYSPHSPPYSPTYHEEE
jgi:hypothetical protein